jgi:hypothetical protein
MSKVKRSVVIIMAVVVQRLTSDPFRSWSPDEELVLDAFRRSTTQLRNSDPAGIAAYLNQFDPEQKKGVLSNVKGIFHEMLFARAENLDGDEVTARLIGATNHPGSDVEFMIDGEVVQEVQLKAVNTTRYLYEHMSRYPEFDVYATDEVAALVEGVSSSGFSNEDLTATTASVGEILEGQNVLEEAADGAAMGLTAGLILECGKAVRRREFSNYELRKSLGDAAIGGAAATVIDLIIGNGA